MALTATRSTERGGGDSHGPAATAGRSPGPADLAKPICTWLRSRFASVMSPRSPSAVIGPLASPAAGAPALAAPLLDGDSAWLPFGARCAVVVDGSVGWRT